MRWNFRTLAALFLLSASPAMADCTAGQFIETPQPMPSTWLPNNNPAKSILKLDLPNGDWDVSGNIVLLPLDLTSQLIERHVSTELVADKFVTPSPNYGASDADHKPNVPGQAEIVQLGNKRYDLNSASGSTTIYGTALVTWINGAGYVGYGYLRARCWGPHT